ncbi:hypothetical protein HHK36_032906 [Tetracentron sinense]|uniref:Uncharacterized protein n=1 Tax=Tetracentron sinense TaxID=13715 RepID=A0A834Y6Z4_TETSI|nr:hypothetical protein HHK36_032906 [Tetracentron sinense]
MEDDNDFTFCQASLNSSHKMIGLPVDQDGLEAQKTVPNIGALTIKDEFSNGAGSNQNSSFLWKDKSFENAGTKKQGTVGFLSFNVIDTSPPKHLKELSKQTVSGNVGESVKISQEQKAAVRKPAARAKVPFEKGYSQMDWLKITRTHPDLAGIS